MNKKIKESVSEEEWNARVELAALYRLVALYGWDDLVFTHISVRVPSEPDHFLLNPYGLLFDEICASDLVKIDLEGNKVSETSIPNLKVIYILGREKELWQLVDYISGSE